MLFIAAFQIVSMSGRRSRHHTAKQRLIVTPGLTCYWQVQKKRNSLTFDQWLEWDIKYIRERSFRTDWKIIFKTFDVIFGMRGV